MKNADVIAILPLACAVILQSCGGTGSASPSTAEPVVSENTTSISQGGSTALLDNDTDLQTSIQGFDVEHVYIVDGNDNKISNRDIALNTRFSIVYEGVKNYTLKNDKAFPDLSIQVIDNDQKTVISEGDLLANYTDGLSEEDATVLRATITTGDPMRPGKYMCSIRIVDKNNKDSFILSTWDFEVK